MYISYRYPAALSSSVSVLSVLPYFLHCKPQHVFVLTIPCSLFTLTRRIDSRLFFPVLSNNELTTSETPSPLCSLHLYIYKRMVNAWKEVRHCSGCEAAMGGAYWPSLCEENVVKYVLFFFIIIVLFNTANLTLSFPSISITSPFHLCYQPASLFCLSLLLLSSSCTLQAPPSVPTLPSSSYLSSL